MKALRAMAAVMAVSASFVLVGCADEDTTDEQTQNQTGTTFSAGLSTSGPARAERHAAAGGQETKQSQAAVIDPNGNP